MVVLLESRGYYATRAVGLEAAEGKGQCPFCTWTLISVAPEMLVMSFYNLIVFPIHISTPGSP